MTQNKLTHDLFNTSLFGVVCVQQWADLAMWEKLFNALREREVLENERKITGTNLMGVVEIGSGRGAMSAFLAMQCAQRGYIFRTYDKTIPEFAGTHLGATFLKVGYPQELKKNAVSGKFGFNHLEEVGALNNFPSTNADKDLLEFIDSTHIALGNYNNDENLLWGNVLVFCDNGNKPVEFNSIIPYLERGDIIAVHDWGTEFNPPDVYDYTLLGLEKRGLKLVPLFDEEVKQFDLRTYWWRLE